MVRNEQAIGAGRLLPPAARRLHRCEVALLQTFVNQAATAVENARLLREIEQRNRDLAASLELQTAMAEVLRLISENPGELGPCSGHPGSGAPAVRRRRAGISSSPQRDRGRPRRACRQQGTRTTTT